MSVSWKDTVHHSGRPRLDLKDPKLNRCKRKTRKMATPSIWICLCCCALQWCPDLGSRRLNLAIANRTDQTTLKDKLFLLVIESGEMVDTTTSAILVIEAHTSAPIHSLTYAIGKSLVPPTFSKVNATQPADEFCQNASRQLGQSVPEFTHHKKRVFVRFALIDWALQMLVSHSQRQHLLNLSHCFPFLSPGQHCMNETMRKNYHRLNMANDLYSAVSNGHGCVKDGTTLNYKYNFWHFPGTGSK